MKLLRDKVAIITGATSGIGEGSAYKFAEAGAKVAIVGRNEKRAKEIKKQILDSGEEAEYFICDTSDEKQVTKMVGRVVDLYKKIDILFNNAGVMLPSMEIERMPVEDWKRTFDINITGYFLVTRAVKPHLVKTKGVILNNASIAGLQYYAAGRSYAYSASKAAVIQFSHKWQKIMVKRGFG